MDVNSLEVSSYNNGTSRVAAVGDSYVVSQFEREYWVSSFQHRDADLRRLGGLSGGPAFAWRNLHYDFVGVIYEFRAQEPAVA